jgi:multidrug efflux pump
VISHFFIERPVFAVVISIVLTLAGGVAMFVLPIAQYPEITPPTVSVTGTYPGASARVVADTVAAPIEQQVNGVENMLYMSSQCTNDGTYNLTVTFALGVDLNMAQVLVQNRVQLAMPQLPQEVQRQGLTVKKKSPNILLVVNMYSPTGTRDQLYLSNYATIQIKDELARLYGVGDVTYLGQQDYTMKIWLDPDKLAYNGLTSNDVVKSIQEQNVQVAAGQIGQEPVPKGQAFQLTLSTLGRLVDVEQFQDIVVRVGSSTQDGLTRPALRVRDVGRVELTAKNSDIRCTLDGEPSVGLAIFQLPGSNALQTAQGVEKRMKELEKRFPEGLAFKIVYDTTPFIKESIAEVGHAFRDAVILVAIVVLVFLQSWRATLIPLIAVPVSIVGTFSFMLLLGFSLNNISLFGLVLAIGIVVDDAIVVVEAVEHHIEHGLSPKEAARKAMTEVTGPVIAVSLVLCAVFVPCAFISGITGQFFKQFAVTIAISTVISAMNSLTLSPALAALMLRPKEQMSDPLSVLLNWTLGWFFTGFNKFFTATSSGYAKVVGASLRITFIVLVVYGGLLYLTYLGMVKTPVGFIPAQDKGYLLVSAQLPDSASVQRTDKVMADIGKLVKEIPGVQNTIGISGQSVLLNANGSNFGSMYVILKPFHERHGHEESGPVIMRKMQALLYKEIEEAQVAVFGPPPVDGLGTAGGYKVMVEDRGDLGLSRLESEINKMIVAARQDKELGPMFTLFRANVPQLYVDVDRTKCKQMGVALGDVFNTLSVYLGGAYVNDFNRFGRTWQVNIQADAPYRADASTVQALRVRNDKGEMVQLGSLARIEDAAGPVMVMRYNMYPSAAVNGNLPATTSTGRGVELVDKLAKDSLPAEQTIEWTEITYMQIIAGNTAMIVFALGVVLVFLVLAAQYESWSLPLAVILVVPMCLLSSVIGVRYEGLDINIFTQIGFVVLVGLAAKNAILIVEFAKMGVEKGQTIRDATVEACRLRLRPILMTSFAFILGVVPLVLASGAGAEMRYTLGIAVFSGMLGVTAFGIFLTPVFFSVIENWTGHHPDKEKPVEKETPEHKDQDGHLAQPVVGAVTEHAPTTTLTPASADAVVVRPGETETPH